MRENFTPKNDNGKLVKIILRLQKGVVYSEMRAHILGKRDFMNEGMLHWSLINGDMVRRMIMMYLEIQKV